jgi:hypothetical protein
MGAGVARVVGLDEAYAGASERTRRINRLAGTLVDRVEAALNMDRPGKSC